MDIHMVVTNWNAFRQTASAYTRCQLVPEHSTGLTGTEESLHSFLTSELDEERSTQFRGRFTTRKKNSNAWIGPEPDWRVVEYRNIYYSCRESSPGFPEHSLVTILTELCRPSYASDSASNKVQYPRIHG
jgi:hypothetical protein